VAALTRRPEPEQLFGLNDRNPTSRCGTIRLMTRVDESSPPIVLDEEKLARAASALDREEVVSASLFGSQAVGRAGPLSDVDVAVWVDPEVDRTLDLQLELAAAAVRALGTSEVDLVILNDAPPLLRHRVIRSQRLLVDRKPKLRVRFEARSLIDYLDTRPLRAELARGLRHRLAEGRFGRR
jgi:predicted nucleotidyltransferase